MGFGSNKQRGVPQECERSAQLLHGGIAPWSRQSAGIQEYSANTPIPTVLGIVLQSEPIYKTINLSPKYVIRNYPL